ncbi:MAG TPA: anthranilate phosphoribosyltransferase [Bryobacteraceae bacterium]|nr:anthranilate phosphoribosyltransferase [Bryobacteraceae bacterium]
MPFVSYLQRAASREDLTIEQARAAMDLILRGQVSSTLIAAFLIALKTKGETAQELIGLASAMREHSAAVDSGLHGEALLDTCGTGGGGPCTFNISTIAALVVAGAGVKVAKHGNRSNSTACGSADIMESLGVRIALPAEQIGACLRDVGVAFLFAPAIHPAMKYAAPVRRELRMRTAFNLLGPLTNPVNATAQLVGASSPAAAQLIAEALAHFGLQRGFVVHGMDGMDEITTAAETLAWEIRNGAIIRRTLHPDDFGVPAASHEQLAGRDRDANCAIAREILNGSHGPKRDIVLVNAAAALVAAGRAESFLEGMRMGAQAIDSGAAMGRLTGLIRFTNAPI